MLRGAGEAGRPEAPARNRNPLAPLLNLTAARSARALVPSGEVSIGSPRSKPQSANARSSWSRHPRQPSSWASRRSSVEIPLLTISTVVEPLGLREGELDQLLVGGIVVEGPGHHQPVRPVDQRVLAPRFDLRTVGLAHHHPDLSAHPEIDLGLRRAPVGAAVKPAPHHLGARPGVEDVLGRSVEGPLDPHHLAGLLAHRCSFRSSRYSPTTSKRRSQRVPLDVDPIRGLGKRLGPQGKAMGPAVDHAAHDARLLQHLQMP